jgi:ribosomal protein L40E
MNSLQNLAPLAGIIIGFIILIAIARGKKTNSTSLVLTKFYVNEDDSNRIFVSISGRGEGIIAWLLTVLKIYGETKFELNDDCISMNYLSMQGNVNHVIPLTCVSSSYCGYSQSIIALILGIFFSIIGFFMLIINSIRIEGLFSLFFGIILLIAFFFSKRLFITVETRGGLTPGIKFKRSIIGNVPVDFNKAKSVVEIIKNKTIQKTAFPIIDCSGNEGMSRIQSYNNASNGICSNCGFKNVSEAKFCEKCGNKLI